jgi:beta-phosphoglucomutase
MRGAFSSKRNLFFDLDGTLVDSSPAHARAFTEALDKAAPKLARSFNYAEFAGRSTRDVFLALGLANEPELTGLIRRKQDLYRAALARGDVAVFAGAADLLARLSERGRSLFLVTGASRVSTQLILEITRLAKYFSGLITAENVPRGKPGPEPYLFALSAHGLERSESIAIEDGEHGLRSAQAAGLEVVTVHGDDGFPGVLHARNLKELGGFFLT